MPQAIAWTETHDAQLLQLRALGAPWTTVATELGVGRNAAIERARRLGLAPRSRLPRLPRPIAERSDRAALPAGHPLSWQTINAGTSLAGEPYPYQVFL